MEHVTTKDLNRLFDIALSTDRPWTDEDESALKRVAAILKRRVLYLNS